MITDFKNVLRRWSTWLATLSASSVAGLLTYATLPARIQDQVPDFVLTAMAGVAIVASMAVPIATSVKQKSLDTKQEPPKCP